MRTNFRHFLTLLICLGIQQSLPAHEDPGITNLEEFRRPQQRIDLRIPDIEGFKTLKCDFHMHTVFSDGLVWPSIRVQEAWQEGLDAICISDHIEHQPFAKDIPTNHNRAHELAKEPAAQANILLIRGSEITRGTPPGHFNAMFIQDASVLVADKSPQADQAAIDAAAAQKAFVFWNHPGWKAKQIPGSYEWTPFVDELHKADKLHGIEVINGFGFHRKALDWCIDRKMAVMGSSDIHNLTAHDYDFENRRTRTMTLLFARDRTPEGVREALESARTVAWSSELLAGPEDLLKSLFKASIQVGPVHHTNGKGVSYLEVSNRSDFTFILEKAGDKGGLPDKIELNPRATRMLSAKDILKHLAGTSYRVTNAYVRSDRNLTITL